MICHFYEKFTTRFFCTSMPFFFPLCCLNADKVIFLTSIKLFFPFLFFFRFPTENDLHEKWVKTRNKRKKILLHLGKIYNKIYRKLESLFRFFLPYNLWLFNYIVVEIKTSMQNFLIRHLRVVLIYVIQVVHFFKVETSNNVKYNKYEGTWNKYSEKKTILNFTLIPLSDGYVNFLYS